MPARTAPSRPEVQNRGTTLQGGARNGLAVESRELERRNLLSELESTVRLVAARQQGRRGDGGETAGSTGGDDTVDDVISAISLPVATDSVDNDFDETTSSISGTVFEDTNNDGKADKSKPMLKAVLRVMKGRKEDPKYLGVYDNIMFENTSTEWKVDQFLQAFGVATKKKRKGTFRKRLQS